MIRGEVVHSKKKYSTYIFVVNKTCLLSRPSSRGANSDYYPIYEDPNLAYMRGQPFVYQQMPSAEQQQPSMLDPTRLEAFRKNWEYYKMWNPQVN